MNFLLFVDNDAPVLYIRFIKINLLYNSKGGELMELYQEAYRHYEKKCESYGIKSIPFYRFMHNLTEDQIKLFVQKAI